MTNIDLISIITIAFLGSFGHCVGMCGGIVIAYTSSKLDQSYSKVTSAIAHLLYSFGRVLTYLILGATFGYMGSVITFSTTANAILLFVAGVAMVLTGLSLFGKIKFLTTIEHTFSSSPWYRDNFRKLIHSKSLGSFLCLEC